MSNAPLYLELEYQTADFNRLAAAWQQLIARHPLLQSYRDKNSHVVKANDTQYDIKLYDLSTQSAEKIAQVETKLRQTFLDTSISDTQWPWFSIKATQYSSSNVRFYMGFSPTMLDESQIYYLLREWLALYQNPELALHSVLLQAPTTATQKQAAVSDLRYHHLIGKLEHQTLTQLRDNSSKEHISLPLAISATLRDALDQFKLDYPVYLTLANRFPFYPYMYDQAPFATSLASVPLPIKTDGKFKDRCHELEQQLRSTALTCDQNNIDQFIAPQPNALVTLFSCNLEQNLTPGPLYAKPADIIYTNVALPIVAADFNAWEQAGQLLYRYSFLAMSDEQKRHITGNVTRPFFYSAQQDALAADAADENGSKKKLPNLAQIGLGAAGATAAGSAAANNKKPIPAAVPFSAQTDSVITNAAPNTASPSTSSAAINPAAMPAVTTPAQNLANPVATANPAAASIAKNNSSFLDAFGSIGALLVGLAGGVAAWQADKKSGSPAATTAPAASPALANLPPEAPAVQFDQHIEELKQTDLTPPNPDTIPPPGPEGTPEDFDAYRERVIQLHRAPTKADMVQGDLNQDLRGMAIAAGPDIGKIKGDLSGMGDTLDTVNNAIASGDMAAACAGIDKLSGDNLSLATKMQANGIPATIADNPLNQKAREVTLASESISTPESAITLTNKVDEFSSLYDSAESKAEMPEVDPLKLEEKKDAVTAAQKSLESHPAFVSATEKLTGLKANADELSNCNCETLTQAATQEKIDQMQQQVDELQAQLKTLNADPASEKIAATQAKADALIAQAKTAQLQSLQAPDGKPSPAQLAALNEKMDAFHKTAGDMASHVQGHCPICSNNTPNAPKVPKVSKESFAVPNLVNPFHVPQLQVDGALADLMALRDLDPTVQPLVDDNISKLTGIRDRMKAFDPLTGMPPYLDSMKNAAAQNPLLAMQEKLKSTKENVSTMHERFLASCPDYSTTLSAQKEKIMGIQQTLDDAQTTLNSALDKQASTQSNADALGETNKKLLAQMDSHKSSAKDGMRSAVDEQMKSGMAKGLETTTKALACMQAMQMPAIQPGISAPDEAVVSGAQIMCQFGSGPKPLQGNPGGVKINEKELLTHPDSFLPVRNIPSMGICTSPNNPAVAANPAKQAPCSMPYIVTGGSKNTSVLGKPAALLKDVKVNCPFCPGGLKLMNSGQMDPKKKVTLS